MFCSGGCPGRQSSDPTGKCCTTCCRAEPAACCVVYTCISSFRQQVTIATERLLWLCRAPCLDHWPISAAARSQRHPWLEGTRQVSCPSGHSAVTQLMSHCCSPCLSSPPHPISGPYILQLWGAIPQPSLVSSSLTVQLSQQTRFRLPVRMQQRGRGSLDRSS